MQATCSSRQREKQVLACAQPGCADFLTTQTLRQLSSPSTVRRVSSFFTALLSLFDGLNVCVNKQSTKGRIIHI